MDKRVAIYCRVSTQMQSTDRQKEELLALSERLGYVVEENHIYVDVITGYSVVEERPQYSIMKQTIDNGEIDTILFSELTRLGRNATELLYEIQTLQRKGVELYFQKQDLWVKNSKKDLGSRILLAVLAITTSYEIELFAERSISGKINKLHNGGGVGGDNNAYGYRNDENKKMIIREDEAEVVKRIFTMYADGKSVIDICDILNSEGVPTSYATRVTEFKERRKQKGLNEKKYKRFDEDNLKWRPSSVSRMLSKDLYIGHRHIVFHKPNVDKSLDNEEQINNLSGNDKQEREVYHTYDVYVEDLRIISDELFLRVKERLEKAPYNKNNALKHENLLKEKLVCGECGANFSVGKSNDTATNYSSGGRTYKCYGRVNRKDKPQTCSTGAEMRQWKLDGLVLSLSLKMFAEINIEESNNNRIHILEKEIDDAKKFLSTKEKSLDEIKSEYKNAVKRLARANKAIADELIDEATKEFETKTLDLGRSIEKLKKEIAQKSVTINKLRRLSEHYISMNDKMDEIRRNKELVKSMIDEFVDKIYIYKIHSMWNLVVVKYTNGVELWGTIKSARYKKSEMFFDETICRYGVEFHTWMLSNTEQHFTYDKIGHTIYYDGKSDIYTEFKEGIYTFDEFHTMLYSTGWMASYPFYVYEDNSANILPKEKEPKPDFLKSLQDVSNVDWIKHNEKVLKRLSKKGG